MQIVCLGPYTCTNGCDRCHYRRHHTLSTRPDLELVKYQHWRCPSFRRKVSATDNLSFSSGKPSFHKLFIIHHDSEHVEAENWLSSSPSTSMVCAGRTPPVGCCCCLSYARRQAAGGALSFVTIAPHTLVFLLRFGRTTIKPPTALSRLPDSRLRTYLVPGIKQ